MRGQHLKGEGWEIGKTRVRRLLKEMDHSSQVRRIRAATTNSKQDHLRYPNLIKKMDIILMNQVWVSDITLIHLAVILDAFTRGIHGWSPGINLVKALPPDALKTALARNPAPAVRHSDQGA